MIMPARWYAGGRGLDEFRASMLQDKHIKRLDDFTNPETVFPGTNIRGGICYFLRDRSYDNTDSLVNIVSHTQDNATVSKLRPMRIENVDTFVRDSEAIEILNKVRNKCSNFMDDYISPLRPFGFRGYFVNDINFRSTADSLLHPIVCYGKGKQIGYVERDLIQVHKDWIDEWKVIMPRANNIGTELPDDNLNAFIGKPKTICTESYLVIGGGKGLSQLQCSNLCSYLRTKFARFMHRLAKSSQDATSKTFSFVPLVDFNRALEDKDLYAYFGLNEQQISYIDNAIKPMD